MFLHSRKFHSFNSFLYINQARWHRSPREQSHKGEGKESFDTKIDKSKEIEERREGEMGEKGRKKRGWRNRKRQGEG